MTFYHVDLIQQYFTMLQMILLRYLKMYLLNQTHPSPLLFFTLFLIKHLLPHKLQYFSVFYLFAVFLTFTKHFNMLYLLPFWIFPENNCLSVLFLLISALSCTKRWKVYLLIFALTQSYVTSRNQTKNFFWVLSGAMCLVIYNKLIFQTKEQNINYFIGFFLTSILNLSLTLANSINLKLTIFSNLLILFISTMLSHKTIANRFEKIKSMKIQNIKNTAEIACFIDLQLQDLKLKPLELAKLSQHSKNCKISKCYCKTNKDSKEFYIRQMFEHFMKNMGSLGDQRLWEYYIDFYLNKDQFVIPYYNLLRWKPNSYFSLMSKLKTQGKIINFFEKANQKIPYSKQYVYGLQYDIKCHQLSLQIDQILQLKINFWKEVSKENLSLEKLQQLGLKIIKKMQKLNYFYDQTIKQYEKYLYCFDSTVVYTIYLIFSTNFKEYAKSLIKNISKVLQEGTLKQNNTSSTFVIKAVVQNSKKSLTKKCTRSFKNQKEISTLLKLEQMYQNQFKLIIDAVSNGFCKMVKIPKNQLIGSELNSLIPNCYKEIHNVRLTQILDFNSDIVKELLPSNVLHSNLVLLFKGANDQLFAGLICIKYNMDIKEGVSFLSVIKRPTEHKCIALTNLSGVLMEKQKGFPSEIIKHQQVKRYLARLKNSWFNNRVIQEQKFTVSINRISYEFTINSPYAFLLYDKECLSNNQPPIHIQLLDQESVKRRYTNQIHGYNYVRQQIIKLQAIINEQKQTSIANSTQTKTSIKSASTINIISNFWQNNCIYLYKYIFITFSIIIFCNLILNLVINLKQVLPWDNVFPAKNPIVDNRQLYNIQILQSKALLNFQDMTYYQKYKIILNTTKISSFYLAKQFPQENPLIFMNITSQLTLSIGHLWVNYSTLLWPHIKERLNQVFYLERTSEGNNSKKSQVQDLTYGQIVFNFLLDNILIVYSKNYDDLLFPNLLSQILNQTYNLLQFSDIISDNFTKAQTDQLIFGVVFTFLIIIFIIPMYFVLQLRFKAHQRVFDLLSSIDCQSISNQIQSLLYISNILNNYKEYRQKFDKFLLSKQNTLLLNRESLNESRLSVFRDIVTGADKTDLKSRHSINITLINIKKAKKIDTQYHLFNNLKYNNWEKDDNYELFRRIKYQIYEQTTKLAKIKGRKRSGELNLDYSEYDQKKKITRKHCLIYLLVLSFIPFILTTMLINFKYIDYSKNAGVQIHNSYLLTYQFNIKLSRIKNYLWEGINYSKDIQNTNDQLTTLQIIESSLKQTLIDRVYRLEAYFSTFEKNRRISPFIDSLKYTNSKILAVVKNLLQFRYNLQENFKTMDNYSQYHNFYQLIFYLQKLSNQRQYMTKQIANYIQQDMFKFCLQSRKQKQITFVVLLVWSLISFILGIILIQKMKHKYFEQVYILTFLNDQMLSKNKRIQSYLDILSKSTQV